jgi:trigger factor
MKVERISNTHAKYSFVVDSASFDHALDHAFKKAQKDLVLDGFRKGKVPRKIYENKFGVESLFEDAINHVVHHLSHEMIEDQTFEIVAQPKVELDIKTVKVGESFEVALVAPIKPEINLGQYKGIVVPKIDVIVKEEEVNREIQNLLDSKSQLEPKDGALFEGDTAIFDFEGFLDGIPFDGGKAENYSLEIGSNQFIPGFESQMIGMNPGEEKDINVKFPENYQAENLAGKDVIFHVRLHEVKIKVAQDLTDEFVLSLNKEGVKTVEELKVSILADLQTKKEASVKSQTTEHIINKLLENTPIEVPKEMIEEEVKVALRNVEDQAKRYGLEVDMFLQLSGINKDDFDQQIQVESQKRVQTTLIIEKIAVLENLQVEESLIAEKFEELSKQYNMPVAEIKKHISESNMKFDLMLNQAYNLVIDSAIIE